jgi:hypothetical protein
MKLSIKLLQALVPLLLINSAYAQKVLKPFPKNEWHVERSNEASGNSYTSSAFRKNINYLSNGGAVAAVDFNNGECGAARIDEKGKTLWEFKVTGAAVGITRMNNSSIVFYSNKEIGNNLFRANNRVISSTVRAAIINTETGKLIKDILMYDNGKKIKIESKPLNKPDGSFATLFVRVTDTDGDGFVNKKLIEQTLSSPKILIIGIDNNFIPKATEIKSPGQKGFFVGAELGTNDDLFLSTILDDQLLAEQFNSSGKLINRLSVPLAVRTSRNIASLTNVDPKNPTSLFLALDYNTKDKDVVHQVFEFNFKDKKVSGTGEQDLNKAYSNSFEEMEIKELRNGYKSSNMEEYQLSNLLINDDRIVIIKGYQSTLSTDRSTHYQNGKVAIEIFDRNWKRLKGITLDRRFELFEPECRSIGATISNGKLHTIFPGFSGLARIETLYAQLDLSSLTIDKFVVLDNPYTKSSARGPVVESDASIWLMDGVLMENCGDESGFFSAKRNVSSFWQKIEY